MKDKKVRQFPKWFEPACIAGFCVTAVLEWNVGDRIWAYLLAIAALVFSVTGFMKRRD